MTSASNQDSTPRTLLDKLWERHVVVPESAHEPAVLAIDLHLVHEVTSPAAFSRLRQRGAKVRRPDRTIATLDHSTPTTPVAKSSHGEFVNVFPVIEDADAARQVDTLRHNCKEFGIRLLDFDSQQRGIVHVIGPELGLSQPGMTVVCGDSHTSTHGAFGSLAFGIGTTEVSHVLATQCLLQRKPKSYAADFSGQLSPGVSAKDLMLFFISQIGIDGATRHAIEYRGPAITAFGMEDRMTICNMSIEAGARAGMIAPDETTFAYVKGRPHAPSGAFWDSAVTNWKRLTSDPDVTFDRSAQFDASQIAPMITWGTNPAMAMPAGGRVPQPQDDSWRRALEYMGFTAGQRISDHHVDVVFLGSCTNGRLSDLQAAAQVIEGRRLANDVRMLVVPGSQEVKLQAESRGLDRIFKSAGAEWREPGCSMCIAMNGDRVQAGQLAVSTSNRNFEGRQGRGSRTLLASPITAAAAAVTGRVIDPRDLAVDGVASVAV
ncbi:MAG: 3-isopropylmalate dehydratase large subunit [Pirellulales bacterium]|nr:3-isopropylmalate dehydratase large subunit [Pirellulales bacterium]